MKHRAPIHLLVGAAGAAASLVLVSGCDYDDDCCDDDHHHELPHFVEIEPNDTAAHPDDFGVLFPLEHFVIEGVVDIKGDVIDPFDGFAFQSSEPLFVSFHLFVDDFENADVRVGLYDVALGQTVAYWYQDHDFVHGELDVFDAGASFHLFVEPLFGDTEYELEIESFFLYGAQAAASPEAQGTHARLAPRASLPLDAAEHQAAARYGPSPAVQLFPAETAPALGTAYWLAIDPEDRVISRGSILFTAGGSWMGMTGEALVE